MCDCLLIIIERHADIAIEQTIYHINVTKNKIPRQKPPDLVTGVTVPNTWFVTVHNQQIFAMAVAERATLNVIVSTRRGTRKQQNKTCTVIMYMTSGRGNEQTRTKKKQIQQNQTEENKIEKLWSEPNFTTTNTDIKTTTVIIGASNCRSPSYWSQHMQSFNIRNNCWKLWRNTWKYWL